MALAITTKPALGGAVGGRVVAALHNQPELVWMIDSLPCSIMDGRVHFDIKKD